MISPRTRMRPNAPSSVRLMAPERSLTVYSGMLVRVVVWEGTASSMARAYARGAAWQNRRGCVKILIVGSGGREHVLAWSIARSPLLTKLFVAPGNPGTATLAENVFISMLDVAGLVAFARAETIDLVVPGPEAPLAAGLADALAGAGIRCCGRLRRRRRWRAASRSPRRCATRPASRPPAGTGLPTSPPRAIFAPGVAHLSSSRQMVLAGGKGVVVARIAQEAADAVEALGAGGGSLVIEECLEGEEVSLFALCDGTHAVLLGAAQDHKRAGDGDTGPNTGGMGAISPPANFPLADQHAAVETFVRPALRLMAERGTPFTGILFAGLMLTASGPMLIEYNVRLGDPEAQVLLPRLQSDLLSALLAACDGRLADVSLRWLETACAGVVLAARGYPGPFAKGEPVGGLDRAAAVPHVAVFHAGTDVRDGRVISSGGRVLTVCGTGPDAASARASAYAGVAAINFPGGFARTDIGLRALTGAAS